MASGNACAFHQHQTGVAGIVGREEPYKRRVLDTLVADALGGARFAADAIHGVVYIVAGAVFHHAHQQFAHLLGHLFAAYMLFQHHRFSGTGPSALNYLAAEKGFHHLAVVGNGIIECHHLQWGRCGRVAIAQIQEVTVRVQRHNPRVRLNHVKVGVHLSEGEDSLYPFLHILAPVAVILPRQLAHAHIRRQGQHTGQVGCVGRVAVAGIDFATGGTVTFFAAALHTLRGVDGHLLVVEHRYQRHRLECRAGLIAVAASHIAPQVLAQPSRGVAGQAAACQHISGLHLHQDGAARLAAMLFHRAP